MEDTYPQQTAQSQKLPNVIEKGTKFSIFVLLKMMPKASQLIRKERGNKR